MAAQNISQWGIQYGKARLPSAHFETTSKASFNPPDLTWMDPPTRRSDKYADDFQNTNVPIGSRQGGMSKRFMQQEMYESTNQRFEKVMSMHRKYEQTAPRFVRGSGGERRPAGPWVVPLQMVPWTPWIDVEIETIFEKLLT